MNQEVFEKIKKIKALVDRGVGGESQNAEAFLAKMLEKYHIDEEELLEDTVKQYEFYCEGQFGIQLFCQICHAVNPTRSILHYMYKRKDCKTRFIECTQAEFIEISEMFYFYRHHLDEGIKLYFEAFIQAEKIFPDYSKYPEYAGGCDDLTDRDVEMLAIAGNLKKHERLLKLQESNP